MRDTRIRLGGTLLGLCLLALTACEGPEAGNVGDTAEGTTEATAPNTLSDAERAEGWQLLFDGESFAAWRGYRSDSMPAQWVVEEGALHFDPEQEGAGGDIITVREYDDFELSLEWKIGECGNSGIFYRVKEDEQYESTYHTGPEMQVLDNTCHADAGNGPDRTAGANYALHPPSEDVTKPAGEWNQTRIVVDSAHVEHWLNGVKVVEYELWSDDWKQRVAASKFTEWPDYGLARSGHIALQDHGDPVWFRNVKIRPLGAAPAGD